MENCNRELHISTAGSRKATTWTQETILWSDFVERLKTPVRSNESMRTYLSMPKARQDDLKDVGGFVGGALKHGRRKASNILSRDLITLDLDAIPAGGTDDVRRRVDGLGCAYVIYSTRKHAADKPRLRVIFPSDRTMTPEEYEPLARTMADKIGISLCDPTTFEPSRLMYYPSVCSDGQFIFEYQDRAPVSVDAMLATYKDWHDWREWPQVPGHEDRQKNFAARQQDPAEKPGVVGAWCRVYSIYDVMEKFIPGVYEPAPGAAGARYTFAGGTTVGGAIIYEDGKFLYSHHATDPCSGRLVNAFDLFRVHKFGDLDDSAKPDTPTNKLPSYLAATKAAVADADVSAKLNQERYDAAIDAFKDIGGEAPAAVTENNDWIRQLVLNPNTGRPEHTIQNVLLVLEHDPMLAGRIRYDEFSEYIIGEAPLPWSGRVHAAGPFRWRDEDYSGLRDYIERILKFRSRDVVDDALILAATKQRFNPVVEYLNGLKWDGARRLDDLFIDYLGAEDCDYTRAVTRKALVAAVARAMKPGTKFDTMTVIRGPQGIGKSTLLRLMGREWYTNSLRSFEGKDAAELLQGTWIVEVDELDLMRKTDVREIKSYLSRCEDHYRAAYARTTEKHPRRCVFFGTTNDEEYLYDSTGNRRFLPIEAGVTQAPKDVFSELTEAEINQIWAEATVRWRMGEPLILTKAMENEAEIRRQGRTEMDSWIGMISEFLKKPLPYDWKDWSEDSRRMFWSGHMDTSSMQLVPRDRVCAIEIWVELFREPQQRFGRREALRINNALKQIEGWEPTATQRFGDIYGRQRGFIKELEPIESLSAKAATNL